MGVVATFFNPAEKALSESFLRDGYVICDADDRAALDAIRNEIVTLCCQYLSLPSPSDPQHFLDHIHERIAPEKLNDLRMTLYRNMNAHSWFRPSYFASGRSKVETLVGNELAMQNRINLSIQMPNDDSSLLGIHADTFGGETPFQIVQWIPLVDCFETKSMFILPYEINRNVIKDLNKLGEGGMSKLFAQVEKDLVWLNIPYGKVLIFSPICLHGNVVNRTTTTRWSMNCRFTGLFTPYSSHEKKIGSFYLPITTRPVSRIGMAYEEPTGFKE